MKSLLFYATLLCSLLQINGQNRSLPELLVELEKNHMGAITDVFSDEEILTLRNHFQTPEQSEVSRSLNFEIFATENSNSRFGHFNRDAPETFNDVGPSDAADFEGAGVYIAAGSNVFIIDNVGNAYFINQTTGIYIPLGMVTAPAGQSFTGLEVNPIDGQIYGISTDGAGNSTLSIINPSTLEVIPIGNPNIFLPIALAFDLLGRCFAYDIDTDLLYEIAIANAAATVIGGIGFDADFGQGMGLGADGNLYMSAFNANTFRSELRQVDTTTGMTTLVGPIGSSSPGGLLQFAWMSGLFNPLSVNDAAFNGFELYPNPVNEILSLESSTAIRSYKVYDIAGALIMDQPLDEPNIDMSSLSAGTYFIAVETFEGTFSTKKFIKN